MINLRYAKNFCKDDISKIENYDLASTDTTQTWHCHHRLELTMNGEFAHSKKSLIRLGMYYNRPYYELIFLKPSDHTVLHNKGRSLQSRTNQSIKMSKYRHSEESKHKISNANKGHKVSLETKTKISKSKTGSTSWNKGISFEVKPHTQFGIKFKEHFGIRCSDNQKLYKKEHSYYKCYGRCSWE